MLIRGDLYQLFSHLENGGWIKPDPSLHNRLNLNKGEGCGSKRSQEEVREGEQTMS